MLAAALGLGAAPARAEGPFAGFGGRWVGGGTIKLTDGKSEKITCRVTYFVKDGGSGLQQNIRCASTSYKFEVSTTMKASGGSVAGVWQEKVYSAGGSLRGKAGGGRVNVFATGSKFSAAISVKLSGSSQSVVISPRGIEVSSVSMGLKKG